MKNININNINNFFMEKYLKFIEQIGEGAFSKLYSAYDFRLNKQVALKIEKTINKNTLLQKEFEIYNSLLNLTCIPKIYNFIPNLTNEKGLPAFHFKYGKAKTWRYYKYHRVN